MEKTTFNVPSKAVKYILFQRTAYLKVLTTLPYRALKKLLPFPIFNPAVALEAKLCPGRIKALYAADMESEYETIREALPAQCDSVLDIGCGVAGIDVFLSRHYPKPGPRIFLLDRTEVARNVFYKLEKRAAFYNSLETAKHLLEQNGVPADHIELVEATEQNDINLDGSIDLVISLISWGFHYPVETYLEQVHAVLNPGGSLILDVRAGSGGLDALKQRFQTVQTIQEEETYHRVLAVK